MSCNKLKLNEDKTDSMLISHFSHDAPRVSINMSGSIIEASDNIKNLGVVFDCDMSMSPQIRTLCRSLYFQIRKIGSIRDYLTENVTQKLVTSLVLGHSM